MDKLANAREQINKIDKEMAKLYEQRLNYVLDVIEHKIENNLDIFDSFREQFIIENNTKYIENSEFIPYYKEFLQNVMNNSKKLQKSMLYKNIIGFQGTQGSFSHIAAKKIFENETLKSYDTFEDVFCALQNYEIKYAVLPFENSYAGEVLDVYELLRQNNLYIKDMVDVKISQNLIGLKDANISDITEVYSHIQALMQCKDYIKANNFKTFEYSNTALAAKFIKEQNDKTKAAIAAKETAEIYDLKILCKDINTSKNNTTRFIVLSRELSEKGNFLSANFVTKHNAGALACVMSIIGNASINVSSIKSKPLLDTPFEYYFYIELEASIKDEKTLKTLEEIKAHCSEFKILGSYFKY